MENKNEFGIEGIPGVTVLNPLELNRIRFTVSRTVLNPDQLVGDDDSAATSDKNGSSHEKV